MKQLNKIMSVINAQSACHANDCSCALGGWEVQAWFDSATGESAVEVLGPSSELVFYAEISKRQFYELYDGTSWGKVGAISANDAAIQRAALKIASRWSDLDWVNNSGTKCDRPFYREL